uniref:Dedicator of cytokinesis protein 9 n=1 Tax=Timema shepardi TaxID=629360 RepID=A0A7R9AR55_TIMSH|nr:unnamed protein product [Timema shepardi]
MTSNKMSERKFSKGLGKRGRAAQLRETVSQVVRETSVQQVVLPRRFRTTTHSVPPDLDTNECNLFTKECLKSYTSNWNLVHYKYSAYSGSYLELPKISKSDELKDEVYEVDTDADQVDEVVSTKKDSITKQGYLMKGPEVGSDRMFVNIGTKSFKRRYCYLRQEVDGTYILELHKDEKKGEAKATIVMDFCTDVVRNSKRGRFGFELRMTAGHKSYSLAADSESELQDWLSKLTLVVQHNRLQEEKRAASLERGKPHIIAIRILMQCFSSIMFAAASNTPPPSPQPVQMYGTLKGLEQSMNPQLMKYARETDMSIAISRRENRRRLFSIYPHMPHVKSPGLSPEEQSVDPYREQFGHRLLFRCESIRFRLQAPIDGEMESLCQAVFNLSYPHPDIFLVVRIDKILQGSIYQTTEPYVKSTKDPRLGLRVHKSVKSCCQRLGNYKMPFAWTARPLFRLYSNELDTSSDFTAIFRQEPNKLKDEEILKILSEYRKKKHPQYTQPGLNHDCPVIGSLVYCESSTLDHATEVGLDPVDLQIYSLTTSLSPLKEFPVPPKNEPTWELMEFEGDSEKDVHPYTTYVNHLYVYPRSLSFDTQKTFTRARNLACVVELRASDEEGAHALCNIYGRPGGPLFVSQCFCTVLHHSTVPTWYEEVKMKLPIHIHTKHHLLFTFYHISCEPSKKRESGIESCVGYSWLPLLHKGRLNVEEQALPVASHLPSGYLTVQPLGLGKGLSPTLTLPAHQVRRQLARSCSKLVGSGSDQSPISRLHLTWSFSLGFNPTSTKLLRSQDTPLGVKRRTQFILYIAAIKEVMDEHYRPIPYGNDRFPYNYAGPEVSWIDGQRPIFSVGFQLVSTVVTRDQHLHNMFSHTDKLLDPKSTSLPSESETCKILKLANVLVVLSSTAEDGEIELANVLVVLSSTAEDGEIEAAHAIQLPYCITFLPTLLNHLFSLLVVTTSEEVGLNIIRVLIHMIHMIHEAGRKEVLQAYIKFVFVPPSVKSLTTVHEEMSRHLPILLRPANTDFLVVNKFMHHSNFFFEIIIKSMAQHLLATGRIKMHRNERFSADFLFRIQNLLQVLCPYLIQKHKEMPEETQELNRSLAQFLKKCLTFMDRGYVFKLINSYLDKFNPGDPKILYDYKFTFLQIICSHEHYVAFNLPFIHTRIGTKTRSEYMSEFCLSEEFCKQHFLVGLLLQEVRTSLNEVFQVRKTAVATLRDLLAKHELDDRYQNKGQLSRILALYVPWLGIVLENLNRLNAIQEESTKQSLDILTAHGSNSHMSSSSSFLTYKDTNSSSSVGTPRSVNRLTLHLDQGQTASFRDSAYFSAIAGQNLINGNSSVSLDSDTSTVSGDGQSTISQETAIIREPDNESTKDAATKTHLRSHSVTHSSQLIRYDKLHTTEVKDLLLCFMMVVKYLDNQYLIAWWQQCTETELLSFFRCIEICLHQFKYLGKRQIATKLGSTKPGAIKAMTLPARMQPPDFSGDVPSALTIHTGSNSIGRDNIQQIVGDTESSKLYQALLEANMATEVGLIALDALGLYCIHFKDNLLSLQGENAIMRKVFDIYLSFLQVGQSETLFRHVFAALRAYINNFSVALFQGNAQFCGRLCYELLRCCNSRLSTIRQESCALLYLLMRSNFEFSSRKGLTRVHLQVIISVSQMLGNVIGLNNARFQESLSLINSYASSDKVMKGTGFPGEVKDLTKRIRTVLMATAQMREHHHDPEMLVDLQHSLANSYASTPELRHTWLETMSRNHVRDGNFSEAAMCQLHVAALMAEYLKLKKVHPWGAEAFDKISSNIAHDERSLKLDAGVQDIQYTEFILLEQLEQCADYMEKAERYELLGELNRLIIPIYEHKRNYEALAHRYKTLAQAYSKIVEVTRSGRRLLGRYYRVAFFGQAYFEEDSGVEYIYKEPKVTSLSEISERLYRLYCDKFGQEVIKIIMDSVPVDPSVLDPKYAYIQVTSVASYFEKGDLEDRQTEFEQSHDINCFMYETPFTKEGKAQGNPEDQWKRRTILTMRKATGNYLTLHLPCTPLQCCLGCRADGGTVEDPTNL